VSTMNVSLPDELRDYVEGRVRGGAYGSTSEYVRDLIRRDRDRVVLRDLVGDGLASRVVAELDDDYLADLRVTARRYASSGG